MLDFYIIGKEDFVDPVIASIKPDHQPRMLAALKKSGSIRTGVGKSTANIDQWTTTHYHYLFLLSE